MEKLKMYRLPELPYGFSDLEPVISSEQLGIHYERHHKAYVDNANAILEQLDEATKNKADLPVKSIWKELSFNVGGHSLHSLFWENLVMAGKNDEPDPDLIMLIDASFGNMARFKELFNKTAIGIEGSGWAALSYCKSTNRLMLNSIEKHNLYLCPAIKIIMVLDVWEHAYYLDYQNNRKKFVESFWDIVNWKEISRRLKEIQNS